jgi:hypothetical protein
MKWSTGWNKDGRHFEVSGRGDIGSIVIDSARDTDTGEEFPTFADFESKCGLSFDDIDGLRYFAEDFLLQELSKDEGALVREANSVLSELGLPAEFVKEK